MRKLFIPIAFMVILAGCREYVTPNLEPSTDPIFAFTGEVAGTAIDLQADGTHKAFSQVSVDTLGITVYEGWLASCANCPPRLHFAWRASDKDNPDLIATTANPRPAFRQLFSQDSLQFYDITLDARSHDEVSSYNWTILGENYNTSSVNLSLAKDDARTQFPARLDISYTNGCSASIVDTVYLPNHGCNCRISIEMIDSLLYAYEAIASGGASYAYEWRFESGEVVPSKEVTFQYASLPNDGVEEVELSVSTGDCAATRREHQFFPSTGNGCAINFDYTIDTRLEDVDAATEIDLGEISIAYTDMNGVRYYSYLTQQAATAFFEVEQVEAYRDQYHSADASSMKVDAIFNCSLAGPEDTILISNARFTLPVGLGAL